MCFLVQITSLQKTEFEFAKHLFLSSCEETISVGVNNTSMKLT
jgi:hypothetical protein